MRFLVPRFVTALAGTAALAGGLAFAAAPAGASTPFQSLQAANGQIMALTGANPGHIGGTSVQNCRVRAGSAVNAQTSFQFVPFTPGTFLIQWMNGDGRAAGMHDYVATIGGPSRFVGIDHTPQPASIWHNGTGPATGEVVNGLGLALRFPASGGAEGVPAGSPDAASTLTTISC